MQQRRQGELAAYLIEEARIVEGKLVRMYAARRAGRAGETTTPRERSAAG
jgi:hypothetical protein